MYPSARITLGTSGGLNGSAQHYASTPYIENKSQPAMDIRERKRFDDFYP